MTDNPYRRPHDQEPEARGTGSPWDADSHSRPPSSDAPPAFTPPHGPPAAPPPPSFPEQYGQNTYGQPPSPYSQPPGPYAQPGNPYGQAGYYGMPVEPKTLSIASMVCGIASVIMGWILLPQIAAIVTGHLALKREPAGKGMSITGLVLGYLCLLGYGAVWLLAIIGLAIAGSSTGTSDMF